jgi:SAM-dependent methyltransferase
MRRALLELLVDPLTKEPLALDPGWEGADDEIIRGTLRSPAGSTYPIVAGIPRFAITMDAGQRQTERSFGFKWHQRATYDSPVVRATHQRWVVERYGFASVAAVQAYFSSRRLILDAGCGGGYTTGAWLDEGWRGGAWIGVDISAAIDVARERFGALPGTHFVQADLLALPFRDGTFDTVFAEGVLHHTPSTERALRAVVAKLAPGREVLFYVYRKKGPIREFTDDYIRAVVAELPPDEAWERLRPLTRLGQALAALKAEVEVPEDIPYLGIRAGRYDVQRLIYWHFAKLFWNDAWTFDENHHVNFDWYHPRYAHRHTEEEVRSWCQTLGLAIVHVDVQGSGFTVRAIKG